MTSVKSNINIEGLMPLLCEEYVEPIVVGKIFGIFEPMDSTERMEDMIKAELK
jgi:hypothetical protein